MTRLYVTADWSRLVPEDSPDAAFFVTEEDARARGLFMKNVDAPPADKAVHHPPEDKGRPRSVRRRR